MAQQLSTQASGSFGNAFHEHDSSAKETHRFLGIIPVKYIRTFHGLSHAVASTMALLIGMYIFVMKIILDRKHLLTAKKYFFLFNLFSGGVAMLFFWKHVQSWMLSTTPTTDRGFVAKLMQNLNRSRGLITPILQSTIPLLLYYNPASLYPKTATFSAAFSEIIACFIVVALGSKIFSLLIQDKGLRVFVTTMYGSYPLGIALTALVGYGGSLTTLFSTHPTLLDACEKNAFLVLTCVQSGYMGYYLFSRRLVSKEFVQESCRYSHTAMTVFYVCRTTADGWWNNSLPLFAKVHAVLMTLFAVAGLIATIKSAARTSVKVVSKTA